MDLRGDRTTTDRIISLPVVGRLIGPQMTDSADFMRGVKEVAMAHERKLHPERQRSAWRDVPGVFYPQERRSHDMRMRRDAGCSIDLSQPTDHVARLLAVTSPAELTSVLAARGYGLRRTADGGRAQPGEDGRTPEHQGPARPYVYDSFHGQRHYGAEQPGPVSDLDRSLGHLMSRASAVHFSVGRLDFAAKEPHIPTEQDLRDALTGNYRGATGDILAAAREQGGNIEYVAVECEAGTLATVTGHTALTDLQKDYADIGNNLRAYFGTAP